MQAVCFKLPLKSLALGLSVVLFTGCVSMGPPPPSATFPQSFEKTPVPTALTMGVQVDYKDVFKDTNLDDTLKESNRVFVPAFKVLFVVSNTAKASVSGGRTIGGGVSSGAKVKMDVLLHGITLEELQSITNEAYADFIAQLKASGREVVEVDQIRTSMAYKAIDFYTGNLPYRIEPSAIKNETRNLILMTPKGLPLWFSNFDTQLGNRGLFDQRNQKALNALSAELKAVAVIPTIVVDFMKLASSGRSSSFFGGNTASIEAEPIVHLATSASNTQTGVNMTLAENAMAAEWGYFVQKEAIDTKGDFGSIKEISSSNHDGFAGFAGSAALSVGAASESTRALVADPKQYRNLALKAIQGFNAAFINAANDNKAK